MPNKISHERNLLFAGLGLQLSLLTKEQMVCAFSEWILNKNLSLSEILLAQKAITPEEQKAIEGAVDLQIQNDGGEAQALASVKNAHEIETSLKNIKDPGLAMTLCTMNALQSRKIVGNELAIPTGLQQTLPIKKRQEQRFQRKNFLDAGNLGEIWFAKDEELNRTVVLKYIKAEQQGSPFTKALFNLEGEVTGYLEHPAVVPVYGMGQDDKERSFYAMRYIRGRKLTRAIADYHALPTSSIGKRREALTELLQAFQTVCLAIEYAHSKGVLHCDLKPDNIVVGPFGETLVIDWGLAMVTNPTSGMAQEIKNLEDMPSAIPSGEMAELYSPSESARPGLHSSQGGMRKFVGGTPAYMAPEQMRATLGGEVNEVTQGCDIFSLGAILYQLLTGRAPYFPNKEKREVYVEFMQRIERGVFPHPRQLNTNVPKPLEAVVLKAMAANPKDRYGSARELAEEVKGWLADEPIHAYRENGWEKTRRWARNNRSAVVAGVVLLGCLGIGGAGFGLVTQGFNEKLRISEKEARKQELLAKENEQKALTQESLANRQKDLAEKREAMAIASVKQYADAVEKNPDLKNKPELESLRKELLKEPIHFFKELSDQLRSEKNPSQKSLLGLASGLLSLADLTSNIGNQEDAITSYKESLTIIKTLVKSNPTNSGIQGLLTMGHNSLANLYAHTNRSKEAEESYQIALALQEALVKANPTNSIYLGALANSHHNLGRLQYETNRPKEAEASFQKALSTNESLVKANPTDSVFQTELALSHNGMGFLFWRTNRLKEAEGSYQKALGLQKTLVKANPTNSEYQQGLAISHRNLANLYRSTNRLKEAEECNQKAFAIFETLVKANPTNSMYQFDLANSHHNLGILFYKTNRLKEAEESYQKALSLRETLVKANPTNSEYQQGLANSHHNLAHLYYSTNREKEAEEHYQKTLSIQETLVKANPTISEYQDDLAATHNNLAILYRATNRLKEAEESYQKALSIRENIVKANPTISEYQQGLAATHHNLAILYSATNRLKEAEESFQKALAIYEPLVKANPTNSGFKANLTRAKTNFANLRNTQAWGLVSLPGKVEEDYQKGLLLAQEGLKLNPQNGLVLNTLGVAQFRVKQFAPALETLQKSNAFNSKTSGIEDPSDLAFLTMTCHQLNNKAEAENYFKKLQEAMKEKKNSENKEYQGFLKEAETLLKK